MGVDIENIESVKILMSSLAVLGGHGDRVRAGCRVKLKINEEDDAAMAEQGTCIAMNRSSGICHVLFDNVKRPVTIQISQIIPISEVSALGVVPINEELLKYLTIFTEPIHFETRKPKESKIKIDDAKVVQKEEEIIEKEDEPMNVLSEWNCPQCTLINGATASTCAICGYQRAMPI